MLKVALFLVAAATVVGCASTRDKAAAQIQPELPQLVTACNGAFRDGSSLGLGVVVNPEGIDACNRLAHARSLGLVDPAKADLYQRYRDAKTLCLAGTATENANAALAGTAGRTCERTVAQAAR